jgi:hypothetical protein
MGWRLLFSRLLLRLDEWAESKGSREAWLRSACTGNHSRSLCLAGIRERSMQGRDASLSCISRIFFLLLDA